MREFANPTPIHETKSDNQYKIEIQQPVYIPLVNVFKEKGIPIDRCELNVYFGRHVTTEDAENFLDFAQDADIIVPERIMWSKGDLSHYLYDVFSESKSEGTDALIEEYGLHKTSPSNDTQFYLGLLKGIKGTKKKILFIDDEDFDQEDLGEIRDVFKVSSPDDIVDMDVFSATEKYWYKLKKFVEFQFGRENRSIERIQSGMITLLERHPDLVKSDLNISFFWGAAHQRFAKILESAGENVHIKKGFSVNMGICTAMERLASGTALSVEEIGYFMLESIFLVVLMNYSVEYRTRFTNSQEGLDVTGLMLKFMSDKTKEEAYRELCKAYNDPKYTEFVLKTVLEKN